MVECTEFEAWRREAAQRLIKKIEDQVLALESEPISQDTMEFIIKTARSYFVDSYVWPLTKTQFYYGHVPKIAEYGQEHSETQVIKKVQVLD